MLFDTHVHTVVSPDSEMDPVDAITRLQQRGFGVTFTEHVDFVITDDDDPENVVDEDLWCARDFVSDLEVYPAEYTVYQNDSVRLGLEIGLNPAFIDRNRLVSQNGVLDFILGSVHLVDGIDVVPLFQKLGYEANRRYLAYTREMIEQNDFMDSLGHIDYISRYSPFDEPNLMYEAYAAEYDAVFRALIERDKVIEVNTARMGNDTALKNLYVIYARYHELGGRYVTIGSDAHRPEDLARYMDKAVRLCRDTGLSPVYFKERKMIIL